MSKWDSPSTVMCTTFVPSAAAASGVYMCGGMYVCRSESSTWFTLNIPDDIETNPSASLSVPNLGYLVHILVTAVTFLNQSN